MKTKLFTFFLLLAAGIGTTSAESGTCGENLTWSFNNRVLSINGTGAMDNYYYQSNYDDSDNDIRAPWFEYEIDTIIINEGVTKIGDYAFFRIRYSMNVLTINFLSNQPCELGVNVLRGGTIVVDCEALDAYHTAWDNYLVKYNGYNQGWLEFHPFSIRGPKSPYTITTSYSSEGWIKLTPDYLTVCDETIQAEAKPKNGYCFSKWEDGKTENPRTFEVNSDITIPSAIFDYSLTGKCGKDSALTWTFEPASMALNITGKGALSENYTYGTFIESLTVGNEVTSIGEEAFRGCDGLTSVTIGNSVTSIENSAFSSCSSLTSVTLGTSVKVIEKNAFEWCEAIETITCYSMRPPTVNNGAFEDLDYSTIVYVPADYLNTYKMHDFWGIYDVRPIGASKTETTEVKVEPTENAAEVVWPAVGGAATYELVIKDKSGNVICTLVFNANGQLTSIAFNAPSRNNAPQKTQAAGFSFTVTGLEEGTSYDLTITSKDNNGTTLDTKTISFTTTGEPQGIEDVPSDQVQSTKFLRDGKMYIIRGDKTYTLTGQEVK